MLLIVKLISGQKNDSTLHSFPQKQSAKIPGKNYVQGKINELKKGINLASFFHVDSVFIQYQAQYNRYNDSINLTSDNSHFQTASAKMVATVNKIPLNIQYTYQELSGWPLLGNMSTPVISFNRELFEKSMSDRIRASFNVNSLVAERLSAIQSLKDIAIKELTADLIKTAGASASDVKQKIQQLGGWKEIMGADASYFNKKLIGDKEYALLQANETRIKQMQEKINSGQPIDSSAYSQAINEVNKVKGLEKMVQLIMKYKKKWDDTGLVRMINKMEQEKDMQLNEMLKNPSVLSKLAKNSLQLQKLEKIFLAIKQLNTGAGVTSMSPLTIDQSLRSSGFDLTSIGKGNSLVTATLGKIQELGTVQERAIGQGNIYQPSTVAAGISFGKNSTSGQRDQFSKISFLSFASSSSANGLSLLSPVQGPATRNFVFTISKKMNIGSKGSLLTEVSKSAAQEQNENKTLGSTGTAVNSFSPAKLLNTNDFFTNLGFSLDYNNEFPSINLSHEIGLRYTGNGYSNQGNSYLLAGSKEIYHSLNKSFLKRKFTLVVRNKFKSYDLNNTGKHFNSFSNTFDLRWKIDKGNYLSVKYQPAYSATINNNGSGIGQNEVLTKRLAADLSLRAKVKKVQIQNFADLAYLYTRTRFAGFPEDEYKTIQLTTGHSAMKNNKQFFVNTNFNYAFKTGIVPYLNSSLLVESGIVYDISIKIKFSSALNYNAVQNWYSQMIVKQGIMGKLAKKIDLSLAVELARNFKVQQAFPVPTFRGDLSIRYQIL